MVPTEVLSAIGVIGGAALLFIAKKLSDKKDETEERKEKAERDIISTLEHERDEYRKRATAEEAERYAERERRIELERAAAELRSKNGYLVQELAQMRRDYKRLLPFAPPPVRQALETDFGEFDVLPPEKRR